MRPNGKYIYMEDLRTLDSKRPRIAGSVPASLSTVHTPLNIEKWSVYPQPHPDREFAAYLLRGFLEGFRVGFSRGSVTLVPAKKNMASARDHPEVVSAYLHEECEKGRVAGPLGCEAAACVAQISRFGVIPKGHIPGRWRLIVDLSAPANHSVNDGIEAQLCSLEYTSADQAAGIIKELGHRCRLAKIDIKSAYRIVPAHPEDRLLLGMKWQMLTQPSHSACDPHQKSSMRSLTAWHGSYNMRAHSTLFGRFPPTGSSRHGRMCPGPSLDLEGL